MEQIIKSLAVGVV